MAGCGRVEEDGRGLSVEGTIDGPRAGKAAVVEGCAGEESDLSLAEAGATGYDEDSSGGEEARRGSVSGVGT